MIVDDSAVVRGMLGRWIEEAPDFELVAVAVNGAHALKMAAQARPDLVVLDVEMPEMSGLEALPTILKSSPGVQVVMASALTVEGGRVALQALDLGAADIIAKPSAGGADSYRADLLEKLRRLGDAAAGRRSAGAAAPTSRVAAPVAPLVPRVEALARIEPLVRRVEAAGRPIATDLAVLVIAASTGGPPALKHLLSALGRDWPTPILITQHMPATFTGILAEQLCKSSMIPVREGVAGMILRPGEAILAPGDWHMSVRGHDGSVVIQLDQGPEENFCRPAADPMFRSVAKQFGPRVLAIVLTGMGKDGQAGARTIASAGGQVFAQDEASSVVWGMPGAVVSAGLANEIGPVDALARAAWQLARGKNS